jgi:hypothetical protein
MYISKSLLSRLGVAVIAAAALAGCNGNKNATSDTAHAANLQQSISEVQNNSHIPDQAKAQIIATMQHTTGAAQH